jgi:DNA repair protein RecN (Recombination protein N)
MLQELQVVNFALIQEQKVLFHPGLNVITGQTGAGKSILLQSLELLMGGKPRIHSIREEEDSLEINALFSLESLNNDDKKDLPEFFNKNEILVTRSVSRKGGSRVYINGKLSTLNILEEIVKKLVDVCGQSHYVRLTNPRYHLSLVDAFAKNEEILARYKNIYLQWCEYEQLLKELNIAKQNRESRLEELILVNEELNSVELGENRREILSKEIEKLTNIESLMASSQRINVLLDGENGIYQQLRALRIELSSLSGTYNVVLDTISSTLEELEINFQREASIVDLAPEKLEKKREELATVARLQRKFKTDDIGLLKLAESVKQELEKLKVEPDIATVEQQRKKLSANLQEIAKQLTLSRIQAGQKLSLRVATELTELDMKDVKLSLQLDTKEFGINGKDKAELLFSSNRGAKLLPLSQIASGGELSRITLVLKDILQSKSGVNVLVFDEVDTGVSGSVARAVGERLKSLASCSQVLCITHLPQVASLADHHLLVEKRVLGVSDKTVSEVRALSSNERIDEIARMLAGFEVTNAARESARELLNY